MKIVPINFSYNININKRQNFSSSPSFKGTLRSLRQDFDSCLQNKLSLIDYYEETQRLKNGGKKIHFVDSSGDYYEKEADPVKFKEKFIEDEHIIHKGSYSGDFNKRLKFLRKIDDYNINLERPEVLEAFENLMPETISYLSDCFLYGALQLELDDVEFCDDFSYILEEEFSLDELNKITRDPDHAVSLVFLLTNCLEDCEKDDTIEMLHRYANGGHEW